MTISGKTYISLAIGLLVSGIAGYVTFRHVPFTDLVAYLRGVNYWWSIPSVVIALISFLVRVLRWQLILLPVKRTGFWSAFHPLMIGFMLNNVLPGRVGEVARPAIFSKEEKISFSSVLATVGVERFFDIFTLLVFFIIILSVVKVGTGLDITFAGYHVNRATLDSVWLKTLEVLIVIIGGIIFIIMDRTRNWLGRVILRLPGALFFASDNLREKIRQGLCSRAVRIMDNLAAGLGMMKNARYMVLCLIISFLVWVLTGLAFYVMAIGCPGINISFVEMCAVMIIICFFIMLPSAPGYWGVFEAGGVFGLMVFGIPVKEAAGFTLANHVIQMVPIIIIGLVSLFITGARMGEKA